ncbi:uncharacterized protein V6R79_014133 [Siganus canaliculatus]
MDPQAVEMGLASGRFPLQDEEASELEVEEEEEEEGEEEAQRRTLAALGAVQQSRNDYLRSGLYSSFSINSLRNQPELLRALRERQEESCSVIRFGTNTSERSSPPSVKPESFISPRLPKLRSPSSPHAQLSQPGQSWSPAAEEEEEEEEEDSDQSSQPLNLSSGHRERALQPPERSSRSSSAASSNSGSSHGDGLPPKSKKPKALEISPSMLLAGSDIGSIALNSPALPSGSLTPAFFTAQTPSGLLLAHSPLLSGIHFWSSLSPVAPLSPARLQGHSSLFQFPSLINGHMPVPLPNLEGTPSSLLLSPTTHKS